MQSDCLCSSLFFEHCNRISLREWVIELCSVCLIDGVSYHNAFAFYLDSISLGIGALLCSSVLTSVRMLLYPCCSAFNTVAKSVCNSVIPPAPMPCKTFCFVCFYRPASCRVCVFILWTSCLVTNKWIKPLASGRHESFKPTALSWRQETISLYQTNSVLGFGEVVFIFAKAMPSLSVMKNLTTFFEILNALVQTLLLKGKRISSKSFCFFDGYKRSGFKLVEVFKLRER